MKEPNLPSLDGSDTAQLRARIVDAAAALIAAGGRDAATTRAVALAAGVQAPAIYRLFSDKRGLLDAVVEHGMASYLASKAARAPHPDPLEELRQGWDMHVEFGLAHPGLFSIMSDSTHAEPRSSPTAAGLEVLHRRIHNIALAGRLRVSQARAIGLLQAVCLGTVLTLLSQPVGRRDPGLAAAARESVMAAICSDPVVKQEQEREHEPARSAVALKAHLERATVLSPGERHLLEELLDRLADPGGAAPRPQA